MLCRTGFELNSRWVPLTASGALQIYWVAINTFLTKLNIIIFVVVLKETLDGQRFDGKKITVVWTIVGLWNRNNSILPSSITSSTLFVVVNTGHNAKKMTSSFTNSRDNTARSLMVKTGSNCAIQSKLSYNNKKNLRPSDTRIYFSKHSVYFNPPLCCPRQNVCDVLHLSWIGTAG